MAEKRILKNRRAKTFGTKAWLAGALNEKFKSKQDGTREKVSSVGDYLNVRKLRAKLWPEPTDPRKIVWVDPPDMDLETDQPEPV